MFKPLQPITSSIAPNYKVSDAFIALKYIIFPWNWRKIQKGKNARKLERKFSKYINSKWAISFNSARAGLYAILKCLKIGKNDEVIIQAFTTVAVPNSVIFLGAKPVYVDIERQTYNINPEKIEEKISKKTKAIIIQHTFGNPSDIDKIVKIAKKNNLFLIEDCAHSLGAEYKNRKTGKFSDAAFFSFGRDKVISSAFGGIVATNNKNLGGKIRDFRDKLPYPKKIVVIKHLLHPIITLISFFLYYFLNIGKTIIFLAVKLGIIEKAYSKDEKNNKMPKNFCLKMPNSLCEIAIHQLSLVDKLNSHRIKISKLYSKGLMNIRNIEIPKSAKNSKNIFLWYTILVKNKNALICEAKKNHILLGDWFAKVVGPDEVNLESSYYKKGSCPIAEEVSSKCVNLPTCHRIDAKDVEKILKIIQNTVL